MPISMTSRRVALIALLPAALLLSGCSSPIVGHWKSADAAAGAPTALHVSGDNTYTGTITPKDGPKKASSGSWEKEGDKKFRLIQRTGDWPRIVNVDLVNNKTLHLVGDGLSVDLKKD